MFSGTPLKNENLMAIIKVGSKRLSFTTLPKRYCPLPEQ